MEINNEINNESNKEIVMERASVEVNMEKIKVMKETTEELKVLCWNLNFGGDTSVLPANFIPTYLQNQDVIIFTEVVMNNQLLVLIDQEEYEIFSSKRNNQKYAANQIMIAARRTLNPRVTCDEIENEQCETVPNYLEVQLDYDNTLYHIIGTRILSETKAKQQAQALRLKEHIEKNTSLNNHTIICGDFNTGKICADATLEYASVRNDYEYTREGRKSELRFFNFHIVKDLFKDNYVLKETMGEAKSWGLDLYRMNINYGGAKLKNDLILYTPDLEVESQYSWDFVRKNEQLYRNMLLQNKNKPFHGFPDHAILYATVKTKGE